MSLTEKDYEQFEEEQHDETMSVYAAFLMLLDECHDEINKGLSDFYRKYGKDGVVTYAEAKKWAGKNDHRKRMVIIFLLFATVMGGLFDRLRPVAEKHFRSVIQQEFALHGVELEDDMIEKILTTKWEHSYGLDTWDGRLDGYEDRWVLLLNNDLKTAFHTGNDVDDMVDDYNIRFDSMGRVLRKFLITETTAVNMLARREALKKQGIEKYRWYTRMDERVCAECGELHGITFPASAYQLGVTVPPKHEFCRCFILPVQ